MELVNANIEEFKNLIYPEYIKLFPKSERKSYKRLEDLFERGILKIIKIIDNDIFVGFMMTNNVENNKYLLLDYLAILPEYQNKGYGTKALDMLKKDSKEYDAIYVEVEKVEIGEDKKEIQLRQKRIEFYERLGFYKLNFDLILYNVLFTPYLLQTSNNKEKEEEIIGNIYELYAVIFGEEIAKRNCKIIKDKDFFYNITPAKLTDMGICPTCFNKENNNCLYGDNTDKILYEDEDIECFLVGNPRAEGHVAISSREHYKDMMEIPDDLCEKTFKFAKKMMNIIKSVYKSESVYLCTMCDGPMNHFHIQLIPRYNNEKRGSKNFVKERKEYVEDIEKIKMVKELLK